MKYSIVSPAGSRGIVECSDDGTLRIFEGDISEENIAQDLRFINTNSAMGIVNTIHADGVFVLRSLETVGWEVEWPEVEGDPDDEDDTGESYQDIDVN